MPRRAIAVALSTSLVIAPLVSAAPRDDESVAAPNAVAAADEPLRRAPQAFTLWLGAPSSSRAGFSLGLSSTTDGRYRFDLVDLAGPGDSPVLAGLAEWSVNTTFNLDFSEGHPRVLLLGPLQRGWDDLDGWEKFGVVLQTAAAAAAAVHFAGKLVEKIK